MTETARENSSRATQKVRMECLKAALDFERELAKSKAAPSVDNLPHVQSRVRLETMAAALLALGVAGMSLFGNFVIFNKILHWTF